MSSSKAVNILQQSSELIERYAKCILNDTKGKDKSQILNDLTSYVLYFTKAIEYYDASEKIFEDVVSDVDLASDELNCDEVLMQFNERIENVKEELREGGLTEKCIHFKEMFLEQNSEIDDEITTVCQSLNTIDPISKLPITDPVKNRKCGHVYEKSTIMELIDLNPRTKCPIAGCSAVDFIKKSDLMPDAALKRIISQSAGNCSKKARFDE